MRELDTNETSGEVTRLLRRIEEGSSAARDRLFRLVVDDLRVMARSRMAGLPPSETLQPTALVNEVYLRLFHGPDRTMANRRHFFYVAGRAMHDILVEKARRITSLKRGGDHTRINFDPDIAVVDADAEELVRIGEAVERLARVHPRAADVVKLKFSAGLSYEDIAGALDVSYATVRRDWRYAKAWLHREINSSSAEHNSSQER